MLGDAPIRVDALEIASARSTESTCRFSPVFHASERRDRQDDTERRLSPVGNSIEKHLPYLRNLSIELTGNQPQEQGLPPQLTWTKTAGIVRSAITGQRCASSGMLPFRRQDLGKSQQQQAVWLILTCRANLNVPSRFQIKIGWREWINVSEFVTLLHTTSPELIGHEPQYRHKFSRKPCGKCTAMLLLGVS